MRAISLPENDSYIMSIAFFPYLPAALPYCFVVVISRIHSPRNTMSGTQAAVPLSPLFPKLNREYPRLAASSAPHGAGD